MTDTKEEVKKETQTETDTIGATESRLLQAMSITDDEQTETANLVDFTAYAGESLPADAQKAEMSDIVESIRTVCDPEIPINVYDMGLIYNINQADNGDLFIDMTLTAPTCPIAGILPQQVADAAAATLGVGKVEVKLVWEPAWTPDKMTDEAKEMLELL